MMVLITYDVSTETRLARDACARWRSSAKIMVSVCRTRSLNAWLSQRRLKQLKHQLVGLIDPKKDSLRFYYLGNEWRSRVEHVGAKASIDLEGPLIA